MDLAQCIIPRALFVGITFAPAIGLAQSNSSSCYSISDLEARTRCYADLHGRPTSEEEETLNNLQQQAAHRELDEDRRAAMSARLSYKNDQALEKFLLSGYRTVARQGVTFVSEESNLSQVQAVTLLYGLASAPPALVQVDYLDRGHNLGKMKTKEGVFYYMQPKDGAGDMRFSGKTTDAWRDKPCKYTVTSHYLLGDTNRDYVCETFAGPTGLNGIRSQIEETVRTLLAPSEP